MTGGRKQGVLIGFSIGTAAQLRSFYGICSLGRVATAGSQLLTGCETADVYVGMGQDLNKLGGEYINIENSALCG